MDSRYWLVRKVCAIVGYYGGLRNIELRSIEFGKTFGGGEKSFEVDQAGYWFCIERGKQRGLPETSVFCVPRRQSDWIPVCSTSVRSPVDYDPASVIDKYLALLESDLKVTRDELVGSFFKSTHGKKGKFFRNVPMGKNLLARAGSEFAAELLLPFPHLFTGHCWRRSCGTNASDAGVNVTTLMAQLGWSTPKTAIGYVKKSRITSFNMSMFLSNIQRQDRDLATVLSSAAAGSSVAQPDRRVGHVKSRELIKSRGSNKSGVSSKGRGSIKKSVVSARTAVEHPVDQRTSNRVGNCIASSRQSASVARTLEASAIESERFSVLHSINHTLGSENSVIQDEVNVDTDGGNGNVSGNGGGGGVSNRGRGGDDVVVDVGGEVREGAGSIGRVVVDGRVHDFAADPRISSILNNLRNHGQIHVHFHLNIPQ